MKKVNINYAALAIDLVIILIAIGFLWLCIQVITCPPANPDCAMNVTNVSKEFLNYGVI